jgi:hypothetical protein
MFLHPSLPWVFYYWSLEHSSKTPIGAMGVITYTRKTTIQHIYSVDVDRFQTPVIKHPWE